VTVPGGGFWQRLIRANAVIIARELRRAAALLDEAAPGPPVLAIPILFRTDDKEITMGDITLLDSDAPATGTAKFLDAKGFETTADDVPTWSSSDESVASVSASEDGLTGTVTPGAPGAAIITVSTVEANTGQAVTAQGTVTVQAGDAVIGSVDFTPGESPAPPA
jgi:hypothetical protein